MVCLQELKSSDETFPEKDIDDAGYGAVWHGQKGWNGVAVLARGVDPGRAAARAGGRARGRAQPLSRVRGRTALVVASIYLPNGNPQPGPKFDYKLRWIERLADRARALLAEEVPAVLAGDYNVIPNDDDTFSVRAMADDALMQPESRAGYRALLAQGWTDALRTRHPNGRRLDLLGLSGGRVAARCGVPHRSSAAQPDGRRPAGRCGRRQGVSRAREGERPCADLGALRSISRMKRDMSLTFWPLACCRGRSRPPPPRSATLPRPAGARHAGLHGRRRAGSSVETALADWTRDKSAGRAHRHGPDRRHARAGRA